MAVARNHELDFADFRTGGNPNLFLKGEHGANGQTSVVYLFPIAPRSAKSRDLRIDSGPLSVRRPVHVSLVLQPGGNVGNPQLGGDVDIEVGSWIKGSVEKLERERPRD